MEKKILHISTVDYGGAGTAAYNLHKSFMEAGNDSRMIVLNKKTNDEHVVEYKFPQFDLFRKGKRKVLYFRLLLTLRQKKKHLPL